MKKKEELSASQVFQAQVQAAAKQLAVDYHKVGTEAKPFVFMHVFMCSQYYCHTLHRSQSQVVCLFGCMLSCLFFQCHQQVRVMIWKQRKVFELVRSLKIRREVGMHNASSGVDLLQFWYIGIHTA